MFYNKRLREGLKQHVSPLNLNIKRSFTVYSLVCVIFNQWFTRGTCEMQVQQPPIGPSSNVETFLNIIL